MDDNVATYWRNALLGFLIPKVGDLVRSMASFDEATRTYTSPVSDCTAAWAEDGAEEDAAFTLDCGCKIAGRDIKFRVRVEAKP